MTRKISDVLYAAANLLHTGSPTDNTKHWMQGACGRGVSDNVEVQFICWAVCIALGVPWNEGTGILPHPAYRFLKELGMPENIGIRNIAWGLSLEELQALRFQFCWFAAQVAEEEGL